MQRCACVREQKDACVHGGGEGVGVAHEVVREGVELAEAVAEGVVVRGRGEEVGQRGVDGEATAVVGG